MSILDVAWPAANTKPPRSGSPARSLADCLGDDPIREAERTNRRPVCLDDLPDWLALDLDVGPSTSPRGADLVAVTAQTALRGLLGQVGNRIVDSVATVSPGGGRHLYVRLGRPAGLMERIGLALLTPGCDTRWCAVTLIRAQRGEPASWVLFEDAAALSRLAGYGIEPWRRPELPVGRPARRIG